MISLAAAVEVVSVFMPTFNIFPLRSSRDTPRRIWSSPFETCIRRRRRLLFIVVLLFVSAVWAVFAGIRFVDRHPAIKMTEFAQTIIGTKPLPPLYHDFRQAERLLPQHLTEPFADGKKYLWVASHACCSGWGNIMQELILTAHLTHLSGRGYVFNDYLWDRDWPAYSEWNGKLIPAHIPLSAIISGPIVGDEWADDDPTPLSISKEHFKKICPNPYILHGGPVRAVHGEGTSAQIIIETWLKFIMNIDDPCVEIPEDSGSIFHPFSFGHKEEILPVWSSLSKSPVLSHFGWSSLARNAVETNREIIDPNSRYSKSVHDDPYSPIDGLLAIHIRRGDFMEHCENLGHWGAAFLAFNQFPDFLDPWNTPQGEEDQKMNVYRARCKPTIEQIVHKIDQVRRTEASRGLRNIYIMTNGDSAWLKQLKDALMQAYAWDNIASSRDMTLTWEEKYVSHTADMLIGQRAQVFIGNGFSSVTSNVAMIRQANGLPPESTRMW